MKLNLKRALFDNQDVLTLLKKLGSTVKQVDYLQNEILMEWDGEH
jgi:hypothetical protein